MPLTTAEKRRLAEIKKVVEKYIEEYQREVDLARTKGKELDLARLATWEKIFRKPLGDLANMHRRLRDDERLTNEERLSSLSYNKDVQSVLAIISSIDRVLEVYRLKLKTFYHSIPNIERGDVEMFSPETGQTRQARFRQEGARFDKVNEPSFTRYEKEKFVRSGGEQRDKMEINSLLALDTKKSYETEKTKSFRTKWGRGEEGSEKDRARKQKLQNIDSLKNWLKQQDHLSPAEKANHLYKELDKHLKTTGKIRSAFGKILRDEMEEIRKVFPNAGKVAVKEPLVMFNIQKERKKTPTEETAHADKLREYAAQIPKPPKSKPRTR